MLRLKLSLSKHGREFFFCLFSKLAEPQFTSTYLVETTCECKESLTSDQNNVNMLRESKLLSCFVFFFLFTTIHIGLFQNFENLGIIPGVNYDKKKNSTVQQSFSRKTVSHYGSIHHRSGNSMAHTRYNVLTSIQQIR